MKLKTLFNKSLIKSDLKRFWWISAVYMILILTVFVYPFIKRAEDKFYIPPDIYSMASGLFFLSFLIPVILGVLLFSYLQTGKASVFFHSINLTRKQNFCSRLVSGFLLIVLPILVNGIILALLKTNPVFKEIYRFKDVFNLTVIVFLYSFVSFSLSVFTSMIVGNSIAAIFFTYVFGFLPLMIEGFITFFKSIKLYGYTYENEFPWVVGKIYLLPENLKQFKYMAVYGIYILILLAAAYFAYKARNLENHSEVVAFKGLKPIFIYSVGIVMGCLGFAYFNGFYGYKNTLLLIPFGILGITAAKMIAEKSFKVLKVYKPCIIYTLAVLFVFAFFKFDLSGFEKRVPNPADVSYATVNVSGVNNYMENYNVDSEGRKYFYKEKISPDLVSNDEIESLISLHKNLVKNRREKTDNPIYFTIEYKLTNGKSLKRAYTADIQEDKQYLKPVIESDGVKGRYFPILKNKDIKIEYVTAYDERIKGEDTKLLRFYENQQTEIKEITDALKKDLKNVSYDDYVTRNSSFTYIEIQFKIPAEYAGGEPVPEDKVNPLNEVYYIRPSYKNTLKVLEKYGYSEKIKDALNDVELVGIDNYEGNYNDERQEITINDNVYSFSKIIRDRETIEKLYSYCQNSGSTLNSTHCITFIQKEGKTFSMEVNGSDGIIKDLIK